jgi:hypothetical protein
MKKTQRTRGRIAAGAVCLSLAALVMVPVARAHECCQARQGCPMAEAGAQTAMPGGSGLGMGPMYDVDTVTTLRGTASAVTVMPARGGRAGGMHLTLESAGQAMDVHLGPTWFLQREGVDVAKGDSVEVTGSVIDSDGNSFLVARELKKGEKVLKLRDEQGVPVWAGGRGRR